MAEMSDEDWTHLDYEVQALFSPATPINTASLIAGRAPQIERLKSAVFERGRHCVLYGERGVGKTSIATTFHAMLPKGRHTYWAVRKASNPKDDYTAIWRRFFAEMEKEDGTRVTDLYPKEISSDDVLRELSQFSLNVTPILIIDEFDKIESGEAKRQITHTIKALSDDGVGATVILVGVADDITFLIEEHASVERNITGILMPRMSDDEMSEVLDQRYPQVDMRIADTARRRVQLLSRGLPEYVHFLGRGAARSAIQRRSREINKADVANAVTEMIEGSDHKLTQAYLTAVLSNKKNNLYKQVLLACALSDTDNLGQFIPSDVLPHLSSILKREIKIANFFPHIESFCGTDRGAILEKRGSPKAYKYRFREPKMQPYVIMKGVADGFITGDVRPVM